MRKHILLFTLYIGSQTILSAQLDTGMYIFKEQGWEYSLQLQENNWFDYESGGFICECASFSNGYYFIVSDTLILSNVPIKGYGESSRFELEKTWKSKDDSITISLEVFDFNKDVYADIDFTAVEQDVTEDFPVLSKRIVYDNQRSNDRGEVNFVLPKNWRGEITNFLPGIKRINIPVDEWTQNSKYRVFIAPNPPSLHTNFNSGFSIEKWLIIKNKGRIMLERIGGEKELTLSHEK